MYCSQEAQISSVTNLSYTLEIPSRRWIWFKKPGKFPSHRHARLTQQWWWSSVGFYVPSSLPFLLLPHCLISSSPTHNGGLLFYTIYKPQLVLIKLMQQLKKSQLIGCNTRPQPDWSVVRKKPLQLNIAFPTKMIHATHNSMARELCLILNNNMLRLCSSTVWLHNINEQALSFSLLPQHSVVGGWRAQSDRQQQQMSEQQAAVPQDSSAQPEFYWGHSYGLLYWYCQLLWVLKNSRGKKLINFHVLFALRAI